MKTWDEEWKHFKKRNFFGKRLLNCLKKINKDILNQTDLPKESKILDLGCGVGETLLGFRESMFKNSIGIDNSMNALKVCEKRGLKIDKDVFFMDGLNTIFIDNEFDFVYSDDVLEH